mgnify:FL=1
MSQCVNVQSKSTSSIAYPKYITRKIVTTDKQITIPAMFNPHAPLAFDLAASMSPKKGRTVENLVRGVENRTPTYERSE